MKSYECTAFITVSESIYNRTHEIALKLNWRFDILRLGKPSHRQWLALRKQAERMLKEHEYGLMEKTIASAKAKEQWSQIDEYNKLIAITRNPLILEDISYIYASMPHVSEEQRKDRIHTEAEISKLITLIGRYHSEHSKEILDGLKSERGKAYITKAKTFLHNCNRQRQGLNRIGKHSTRAFSKAKSTMTQPIGERNAVASRNAQSNTTKSSESGRFRLRKVNRSIVAA